MIRFSRRTIARARWIAAGALALSGAGGQALALDGTYVSPAGMTLTFREGAIPPTPSPRRSVYATLTLPTGMNVEMPFGVVEDDIVTMWVQAPGGCAAVYRFVETDSGLTFSRRGDCIGPMDVQLTSGTLRKIPAAAAPSDGPPTGTVQVVTVHGPTLEGNLEGDPADRAVYVYLPPSYAFSPDRHYPVVYTLHGYGFSADSWLGLLRAPATFDAAIADLGREMIIVSPDAFTVYGGSMYSNSPATGDWESFVAKDLVSWVDAHYRTIPTREGRGLAGHSMGGYGVFRIGMKHPETFSSLYAMSACCLTDANANLETISATGQLGDIASLAALEQVATVEEARFLLVVGGTTFASAAAWSANPAAPPFYLDLPTRNGEPNEEVIARFRANTAEGLLAEHVPALKSFDAITLEVGDKDFAHLMAANARFHDLMGAEGISHSFAHYDGDHLNQVSERFEKHVLPFFAEHLAFD